MPHMMPMLWLFMMLFTLTILFLIISLIYFMYMPSYADDIINHSMIFKIKWIWKW